MENKKPGKPYERLLELLIVVFIILGIVLIAISFIPMPLDIQTITRSIGLSLVPGGLVTLAITRYASSISQKLLRKSVKKTIRKLLGRDMKVIDTTVRDGLEVIDMTVENGLIEVEKELERLSPLFAAASKLGLEDVLLNRWIALEKFARYLNAEIQKAEQGESAHIWMISSSLKGFLEASSEYFDGPRMMEKIAHSCQYINLRIMFTDPKIADSRAKQERRESGDIPQEVMMNLSYLKRIKIPQETIRLIPGLPSVFGICTTDRMLLNPYPYQTEAFRCFSIIVRSTLIPTSDIFTQYLRNHFQGAWETATPITTQLWNKI